MKIRALCIQYQLQSPLEMLHNPPPKTKFKSIVKSQVIDYWEAQLRHEVSQLKSLTYFKPKYMSLVRPHPVWTTCGSNSFEVNKAIIQARMLSGRYCTDQLSRFWTKNRAGICQLQGCSGFALGSLEHLLLQCPALHLTRAKMFRLCLELADRHSLVKSFIHTILYSQDCELTMQFLLDCSSLSQVISLQQAHGSEPLHILFYASRNWCYAIHRKRMDLLGLYQYR